MNYIVLEQQTNAGVTAIVTPDPATNDLNAALSSFLIKAGYAAISNIEIHTVSLMTEDGRLVRPSECFRHPVAAPEPEVSEPEEESEEEPVEP